MPSRRYFGRSTGRSCSRHGSVRKEILLCSRCNICLYACMYIYSTDDFHPTSRILYARTFYGRTTGCVRALIWRERRRSGRSSYLMCKCIYIYAYIYICSTHSTTTYPVLNLSTILADRPGVFAPWIRAKGDAIVQQVPYIWLYLSISISIHLSISIHPSIYIYPSIYLSIYLYLSRSSFMYIYIPTYIRMHTHTHIHIYILLILLLHILH